MKTKGFINSGGHRLNSPPFSLLAFYLLSAYSLFLPAHSLAQISFEKTYGGASSDFGRFVQETSDGGYILIGGTESFGAGGRDVYLIKTNSLGETLWTKTYGGMENDWGYSVHQSSDGGYILAGVTWSFGVGSGDVYLIKTDPLGNPIWIKTFGGPGYDFGYSVQETSDGGFIIAGGTASFGAGDVDVYLIKTDSLGNILWTKTYGGSATDYGYPVQLTSNGGFIITGFTASFGSGSYDVYLIKTDLFGDSLWTKTHGGSLYEEGWSVQETSDGGLIITGYTESIGAGGRDVYLIKTNSSGEILWTRTYGGTNDDYGHSVQETTDEGFFIAGFTASIGAGNVDVYLIKTDSSGDTLWTKTYGGSSDDYGVTAEETSDGGFIIAGHTMSFGAGSGDVYLIKTESFGKCEPVEPPLVRTQGYWRRQCMENPHEDICTNVDSVHALSDHFDSFECDDICDLMEVDPPENDMCRKAERQFMALLLNVASRKLALCNCLSDGRTVEDVIAEIESLLSGSQEHATCERAKTLADEINTGEALVNCNGQIIAEDGDEEEKPPFSFPNPFVKRTTIRFKIPAIVDKDAFGIMGDSKERMSVRLGVFDVSGRIVKVLLDGMYNPGEHAVDWNGEDENGMRMKSGIYFYRLDAGSEIIKGKLILVH